jgi:YD repeat-containing protein
MLDLFRWVDVGSGIIRGDGWGEEMRRRFAATARLALLMPAFAAQPVWKSFVHKTPERLEPASWSLRLCYLRNLLAAALLAWPCVVFGGDVGLHQNYLTPPSLDAGITPLKADTAFGDQIDLRMGGVTFDVVDIDIPGNSSLPVRLGRRFEVKDHLHNAGDLGGFGEWDIDIPRLHGTFADGIGWQVDGPSPYQRCSNPAAPPTDGEFTSYQYWGGYWLYVPGSGDQALLSNPSSMIPALQDGKSYPWITKSFWRIRCESSTKNGYPGEGFIAVSPEGVTYYFDWVTQVAADSISKGWEFGQLHHVAINRDAIYFLLTRVEDRFGNWVNYRYSGDQLQSITSDDGRFINLTWSGNHIVTAVSSKGTWHYSYNGGSLNIVTLPDNSEWRYSFTGSLDITPPNPPSPPPTYESTPRCSPQDIGDGGFSYTVVHPAGAKAVFNFVVARHYRANVPKYCNSYLQPSGSGYTSYEWLSVPNFFDTFTLTSKQVTGPGLPSSMNWTYAYDGGAMLFAGICQIPNSTPFCPESTETEVSGPGPVYERYFFGAWYGINEGQLLEKDTGTDATHILRTETYTYSDATSQPFPDSVGTNWLTYSDALATKLLRPQSGTVINQGGVNFTTSTNSFDAFARPTSETQTGTGIGAYGGATSRIDTTTYADDTGRWVLGMVKQKSVNGTIASKTDYDSLDRPTNEYAFGKRVLTKAWNNDGTLASVTDGDSNTTTFSRWHRGLPQTVKFADNTTKQATVDDNGWITSLTDESGAVTGYKYDLMGRLAEIDYPSDSTNTWNATMLTFAPVNGVEYGIPAGHWKQTVQTGTGVTNTYFDAFWRPLVTEHYDSASKSATMPPAAPSSPRTRSTMSAPTHSLCRARPRVTTH